MRALLLVVLLASSLLSGCGSDADRDGAVEWPVLMEVEAAVRAAEDNQGGEEGRADLAAVVGRLDQLLAAGVPDGVDDPGGCAALMDDLRGLAVEARRLLAQEGGGASQARDLTAAMHPVVLRLMEVSGAARGWCPSCGTHHDEDHAHGGS